MSINNDSASARTEMGSVELATLLAFEMSELSDFSTRTWQPSKWQVHSEFVNAVTRVSRLHMFCVCSVRGGALKDLPTPLTHKWLCTYKNNFLVYTQFCHCDIIWYWKWRALPVKHLVMPLSATAFIMSWIFLLHNSNSCCYCSCHTAVCWTHL